MAYTHLGSGTFGNVVKCFDQKEQIFVAVKIMKNGRLFFDKAQFEIKMLKILNEDKNDTDKWNFVYLKDEFIYCDCQCLVFELLSINLFELLLSSKCKGISLDLITKIAWQLLETLDYLAHKKNPHVPGQVGIIHCDLKPENIVLRTADKYDIKVIDFGSSCFVNGAVIKFSYFLYIHFLFVI